MYFNMFIIFGGNMRKRNKVYAGALAVVTAIVVSLSIPNVAMAATFTETAQQQGIYGPSGTNWPSNTPTLTSNFVYDVEVAPTWSAIQTALNNAPSSGNAIIRVQPGVLPAGNGAGSTNAAVLSNNNTTRTSKILIVPRDGYGTVSGNGTGNGNGYSFTLNDVALLGFNFRNQNVVVRGGNDAAYAWSSFGVMNVTANQANSTNLEFIETVIPDMKAGDTDSSAVRVANGYSINGLKFIGSYWAPTYKQAGSSAHTDSLQFSGTGNGVISNVVFSDSALFQSSNQGIQAGSLSSISFEDSVIIGGQRGTGRYPLASGQAVINSANALWGGAGPATADGLIVMGSINSNYSWASVTNSYTPTSTGSTPSSGSFTVEPSLAGNTTLQTPWINTYVPNPTDAYLTSIWGDLTSGGTTPTPTPTPTEPTPPATVKPAVSVTPSNNSTVTGDFAFVITATSDTAVTNVKLTYPNLNYTVPLTKGADGKWRSDVLNTEGYPTGQHTFVIEATDSDGDKTIVNYSLQFAAPQVVVLPTITKAYPTGNTLTGSNATLAFEITSDSAITTATVRVVGSNDYITLTKEGNYFYTTFNANTVPDGNYVLEVRAIDSDGDVKLQTFTLRIQ